MSSAKQFPLKILEEDGPFEYVYLSIASIPGIKFPSDSTGPINLYKFPELGAEAILTDNCDEYLMHMHRSDAIAYLLLTGFRGHKKFGWISVYWHKVFVKLFGNEKIFKNRFYRETELERKNYQKQQKNIGCYLIYKAMGKEIQPNKILKGRKVGKIGFGIDIISGKEYREFHKAAMHNTATALSLSLVDSNSSTEIHFGRDIIYLKGNNGLRIYPRSISMGTPGIIISSPPQKDSLEKANVYIPAMMENRRLQTAISLYIESQKTGVDNLRAFIAVWSALELLVNRLSKKVRPKWNKILEKGNLPDWDNDLKCLDLQRYRLRDRFFTVVCVLDLGSVEVDTATFIKINNMRSEFYHQMAVVEKDLPTIDARTLFQKYLKLGLTI